MLNNTDCATAYLAERAEFQAACSVSCADDFALVNGQLRRTRGYALAVTLDRNGETFAMTPLAGLSPLVSLGVAKAWFEDVRGQLAGGTFPRPPWMAPESFTRIASLAVVRTRLDCKTGRLRVPMTPIRWAYRGDGWGRGRGALGTYVDSHLCHSLSTRLWF